ALQSWLDVLPYLLGQSPQTHSDSIRGRRHEVSEARCALRIRKADKRFEWVSPLSFGPNQAHFDAQLVRRSPVIHVDEDSLGRVPDDRRFSTYQAEAVVREKTERRLRHSGKFELASTAEVLFSLGHSYGTGGIQRLVLASNVHP